MDSSFCLIFFKNSFLLHDSKVKGCIPFCTHTESNISQPTWSFDLKKPPNVTSQGAGFFEYPILQHTYRSDLAGQDGEWVC